MSKKNAAGMLRFVTMLCLIFEKGMSKNITPRMVGLVSMLFYYLKKE